MPFALAPHPPVPTFDGTQFIPWRTAVQNSLLNAKCRAAIDLTQRAAFEAWCPDDPRRGPRSAWNLAFNALSRDIQNRYFAVSGQVHILWADLNRAYPKRFATGENRLADPPSILALS